MNNQLMNNELQQEQQEQERLKKFRHYNDRVLQLQQELEQIVKDLEDARQQKQPTGAIYTEKHRICEEIKECEREVDKCKPPVQEPPSKPNLAEKQFAIATSSVRRKSTEALKEAIINP